MKRNDIDWAILRGAIITLVISVTVSGAIIGGTYYFQEQMEAEFNRSNAQFQNISRRYLAVDEEEKLIKNYYPRFLDLYSNGVIGKEQRLNWIEVLRKTGEEMKLPSLNYEIRSQEPYLPAFPANTGRFQLYRSGMGMSANLIHEVDLIRLFEFLNRDAAGIYTVGECRINRTGIQMDLNQLRPNLSVACELNWLTIRLADGIEISV